MKYFYENIFQTSLNLSDTRDPGTAHDSLIKVRMFNFFNSFFNGFFIQKIYLPTEYQGHEKHNDIALLEMTTPVEFGEETCISIRPACIFNSEGKRLPNMTIMGFGVKDPETRDRSDWLLKGTVREMPLNECQEKMAHKQQITDTQICAHDEIFDACQGA